MRELGVPENAIHTVCSWDDYVEPHGPTSPFYGKHIYH
jgi:hypothetical protein